VYEVIFWNLKIIFQMEKHYMTYGDVSCSLIFQKYFSIEKDDMT
jgi:hypothetical protein